MILDSTEDALIFDITDLNSPVQVNPVMIIDDEGSAVFYLTPGRCRLLLVEEHALRHLE